LRQGDYGRETVFGDDPVAVARRWRGEGATHVHLVDLDGARDGRAANGEVVRRIVVETGLTCQLGGGIRDAHAIGEWLDLGIDRLVVGTRAVRDPDWFRAMCRCHPGRLVLGLDARDGIVATDGWREMGRVTAADLAVQFAEEPIAAVVYTDIARDGMMEGANIEAIRVMRDRTALPLVASGGVTTIDDVRRLAELRIAGCIIGRALYENAIPLADALRWGAAAAVSKTESTTIR